MAILATVGVLLSQLLVAAMMFVVVGWLGLAVPWVYCLVFGALISPTDPIAVLDMLRRTRAPQALEIGIVGGSLLNDGVGIVAFVACSQLLVADLAHGLDWRHIALLALHQAVGGLALGALLG